MASLVQILPRQNLTYFPKPTCSRLRASGNHWFRFCACCDPINLGAWWLLREVDGVEAERDNRMLSLIAQFVFSGAQHLSTSWNNLEERWRQLWDIFDITLGQLWDNRMLGLVDHFVLGAHYSPVFEKLWFFHCLCLSLSFSLCMRCTTLLCPWELEVDWWEGGMCKTSLVDTFCHYCPDLEKLGSLSLFLSSRHKTALFF